MLEEVLTHLNNWFVAEVHTGTFTAQDGSIALPFLQDGQYYRICGSVFNDGLYCYGSESALKDETWDGAIWALAIPNTVISLSDEIDSWKKNNEQVTQSPYQSESFGGYSYTKASGTDSGSITWQSVFRSTLNQYRKLKGCEL